MAELLVKADGQWMDSFTADQIAALSVGDLASFNTRHQMGDIIFVEPDGWNWEVRECLPSFVVIKLPGVSEGTLKYLEGALYSADAIPVMLKVCKYAVPQATVLNWVSLGNSKFVPPNAITFTSTIITKTS